MADIFLSYKREERTLAEAVVQALIAEGFSVWWDNDLTPRATWDAEIEREVAAAKAVVVLWSPLSVAETSFVRAEAGYALHHRKLVPAFIKACELPLRFRDYQTADLTRWTPDNITHAEWQRALGWIRELVVAREPKSLLFVVDDEPTALSTDIVLALREGLPRCGVTVPFQLRKRSEFPRDLFDNFAASEIDGVISWAEWCDTTGVAPFGLLFQTSPIYRPPNKTNVVLRWKVGSPSPSVRAAAAYALARMIQPILSQPDDYPPVPVQQVLEFVEAFVTGDGAEGDDCFQREALNDVHLAALSLLNRGGPREMAAKALSAILRSTRDEEFLPEIEPHQRQQKVAKLENAVFEVRKHLSRLGADGKGVLKTAELRLETLRKRRASLRRPT